MKKTRLFLAASLLLFAAGLRAQESPVKWTFRTVKVNDTIAELQLKADIEPDWHLYALSHKGMEIPLSVTFAENGQYRCVGKTLEPKPTEQYDEVFGSTSSFFTKNVTFRQRVRVLDNKPFAITGKVEGQACREGRCTPVEKKFSFSIKGFDKVVPALAAGPAANEVAADSSKTQPADTAKAVTEVKAAAPDASDRPDKKDDESMVKYFLMAIVGGLAGLLMPCVFPMIPMTVSYFTKNGHKGKRDALLYGLFIILIFVIFGILLSVIFGAGLSNVLSTHWIPNLLFAVIFLIFAFSLLGYFEISLPNSWVNGSAKRQKAGGIVGIFFMALTLVLVSFSCTLPIAGAVALNAAGGSLIKPVIGMLGFSLGIAVPFTLFALFPNFLKKMPKSGSWMNTLKVVLAFIELAFALKFINVPDQTYHWGILDREVYLSFWIVLFTMLALYLMGAIRFPLDEEYRVQKSWFRFTLAIFVFSFVVYMIPGLFGAPLKAISGWLPPMTTQDFNVSAIVREETAFNSGGNGSADNTFQMRETPLYGDKLKGAMGIKAYFDYDQALRVAKEADKPVFLDFTGHGCTNCRNVENAVWINTDVRKILTNEVIVATLYVDDKVIKLPETEHLKDNEGDPVTTLGGKNRLIQNNVYHENSQPCYFIVDTDGSVLVGPVFYELDPAKYMEFLRTGIDAYNKKHGK